MDVTVHPYKEQGVHVDDFSSGDGTYHAQAGQNRLKRTIGISRLAIVRLHIIPCYDRKQKQIPDPMDDPLPYVEGELEGRHLLILTST